MRLREKLDDTQSLGNEEEKDKEGLHRLSDIRPVEVSIVHPPANQESFHIVKSEGIMDVELKEREDGTLEIAEKSAEEQTPTETAATVKTEEPSEGNQSVTQKVEGQLSRGAREAAERLLSLANQAKAMKPGDKMTPAMLRELKAVSTMLSALQQKYPSPTSKAVSVEVAMLAKADGDLSGLYRHMAEEMVVLEKREAADAAEVIAAMINTIDGETRKAGDKPADKTSVGGRKRFTPARVAKLLNALKNISEVMKEVDADSLTDLFSVAKTEPTAEAEVVSKALEPYVQRASDASTIEALNRRIAALEATGVSKSLGGNDTPTEKSAKTSIFDNVVFG